MKILFLFPHFIIPGGAARVTLDFAHGLQKSGHTIEILCANASPDFLRENSDLKISQLCIPNSDSFWYWILLPYWQIKINKTLKKYPGYILFPQVLPSNWWAWIYKLFNRKQKIVWYCHEASAFIHSKKWINSITNPFMRVGAKIFNLLLKKIDIKLETQNNSVVCNSWFTAGQYEKCYNRKAAGVAYPPLEIKSIEPEKNKERIFFTITRLSKFKNLDFLIDAFSEFSKLNPGYKLIIAGDGEEKTNLEKITRDKKMEEKIFFPGKISDEERNGFYKKAVVTILCSHNEPFGIVPIESMMHGTPVIAHNSGGPKETIQNGKNGFLFDKKSNLVKYLEKLAEMNRKEYFDLQNNCQREVEKYEISNLTNKLNSFLKI